MFEELNKKSPASRMSSNALPEFRSKSQALLFSLMYYRCDRINPDGQFVRARDLYKLILEQIPSLKETEILITPKSMVEEAKEIVDHIFNKKDEGLERFIKEVFGNPIPGVPEDKCGPDTEPDTENVCQGHPCGTQEREEINEVSQATQAKYIREEETEELPDSGSDV